MGIRQRWEKRNTGVEPVSQPWEGWAQPLYQSRAFNRNFSRLGDGFKHFLRWLGPGLARQGSPVGKVCHLLDGRLENILRILAQCTVMGKDSTGGADCGRAFEAVPYAARFPLFVAPCPRGTKPLARFGQIERLPVGRIVRPGDRSGMLGQHENQREGFHKARLSFEPASWGIALAFVAWQTD